MGNPQLQPPANQRLDSWKEIAAFFGRDERTVKRWEKERAMPVHRFPGSSRGRVFAYATELTRWLEVPASGSSAPLSGVPHQPLLAHDFPADLEATTDGQQEEIKDRPGRRVAAVTKRRVLRLTLGITALLLALVLLLRIEHDKTAKPISSAGSSMATVSQEHVASTGSHTPTPEAEELYLKGRYYWTKRTPESLHAAVDYFTQAIAKDPNYAGSYVGLADCYNLLREYTAMPANQAFPLALAAAERAVELDGSSAQAQNSLAFASFYWNWDAAEAERHFKRAITLNPDYATAHHWYATFLLVLGRYPESLAEIEAAQHLDPSSRSILSDKGLILFSAGQQEKAIVLLRQIETAEPTFLSPHRYLAEIYLATHDDANYLKELEKTAVLSQDDTVLAVARAGQQGFARSGERGMYEAMLARQKKLHVENRVSAYQLARTYALLGERRQSLAYLNASYQARESEILTIRNDFILRPLHSEAAFRALVSRIGLPPLN
jgi:Tfp pilus assembly protein PilF